MKDWTIVIAAPEQYILDVMTPTELAKLLLEEEVVLLEIEEG